ncbi:MAG: hypothetical protein WBG69_02050 [Arcobacteraceae bacterium]
MSKLKYGLGAVIIAGGLVGTIPYITKNTIDTLMVEKQKELINYGIDFQVVSNTGYLDSTREVTLKFKNTAKVLEYLAISLQTDLELLKSMTNDGDLLADISFKGVIKNSNLMTHRINAVLQLDELPKNLKEKMTQDEPLDKFIKSLGLNMSFDIDGNVTDLALNDIIIEDQGVLLKLIKPKMQIFDNQYKSSIQNITFNTESYSNKLAIQIDDIQDHIKKTDVLNATENTTIKSIKFDMENHRSYRPMDLSYESANHIINANIASDDKLVNMTSKYDIDDIKIKVKQTNTTMKHLTLGVNFKNLDRKPIQDLVDSASNQQQMARMLEPKLFEILNSGFQINLKTNVTDFENVNFSSKMIDVNVDLDVKKNTLYKRSRPNDAMGVFTVNGTVKLDAQAVSKIAPIQKFNTNISNGISQFDIKFENGSFTINGQAAR